MSSSVFVMLWREENKEKFREEFMRRHNQGHKLEEQHDMQWVDVPAQLGLTPEEAYQQEEARAFWAIPSHWDEEHNLDMVVLAAQVLHDLGIWGDIQPSPGCDAELPREPGIPEG